MYENPPLKGSIAAVCLWLRTSGTRLFYMHAYRRSFELSRMAVVREKGTLPAMRPGPVEA